MIQTTQLLTAKDESLEDALAIAPKKYDLILTDIVNSIEMLAHQKDKDFENL